MEHREMPNEVLIGAAADFLKEGREVVLTPKGSSMLPFIRGQIDSVRLKKKDTVKKGDIVLADLGDRYVLHRVFREDGPRLTLMGDGNIKGVESCDKSDILGTVTSIIRPSGKEIKPGKGGLWRALLPVRRYILAIYRRLLCVSRKDSF